MTCVQKSSTLTYFFPSWSQISVDMLLTQENKLACSEKPTSPLSSVPQTLLTLWHVLTTQTLYNTLLKKTKQTHEQISDQLFNFFFASNCSESQETLACHAFQREGAPQEVTALSPRKHINIVLYIQCRHKRRDPADDAELYGSK